MRLVHLTDPHLSHLDGVTFSSLRGKRWSGYISWCKNRRQHYLPGVLDRLSAAVKAEHADQILLTGDLVQIGLETEIAQATNWLETLGSADRVMLVPGNHDIYAAGSSDEVHRAWAKYLFKSIQNDGDFPVVCKLGKLTLIGLSSACVTPLFMASGKLGQGQIERLVSLLDEAAAERQFVCLLIHHPPLPGMTNWRKGLADAVALQAVLDRYPSMLILHGHLHHNREQGLGDTRIYCTAAASSASEASFRVFDIEDLGASWSLHMALKTLVLNQQQELGFSIVDEQVWQITKQRS